jgi:hypothetical protein
VSLCLSLSLSGAVLNHMRASSADWEAAVTTLCAENNVEGSRLDKDRIQALAPAARSEFCLSSAIVGGIAAQEIIKFVTGRGKPMENQFYFDALDPKCEHERRWSQLLLPASACSVVVSTSLVVLIGCFRLPTSLAVLRALAAWCSDPGIIHNNAPQPVGEAAARAAAAAGGPPADHDVLVL